MSNRRSLPYIADSSIYFNRIRALGNAVYLDSGRPLCPYGRFDIIAAAPAELVQFTVDATNGDNPFDQLRALSSRYAFELETDPDLPFQGGLIGHFSYDLGRALESMPAVLPRPMRCSPPPST